MRWLGSIFGGRKREKARRALELRVRSVLESEGPGAAWRVLEAALRSDPDPVSLFHLAAHVLRLGGERGTAELFDRAADAPHDPQRLFELGSELTSADQPEAAAAMLERALAFAPFDAVVRSELAIAQARAGWPDRVVETLALHPCLADDPGALFQFGWASLLCGDLRAAQGALTALEGARELRGKLQHAIERARVAATDPSARSYAFVEHGALVLDDGGSLGGRHAHLIADRAWIEATLGSLGWVLRELVPAPRRVIAIDQAHRALAGAVARACDGVVVEHGRGRAPTGVIPLLDAAEIDALARESADAQGVLVVALTMDFTRSAARVPHVIGAFARAIELDRDALADAAAEATAIDPALRAFVESRRAFLPPNGPRVRTAYVPDEPLPR